MMHKPITTITINNDPLATNGIGSGTKQLMKGLKLDKSMFGKVYGKKFSRKAYARSLQSARRSTGSQEVRSILKRKGERGYA